MIKTRSLATFVPRGSRLQGGGVAVAGKSREEGYFFLPGPTGTLNPGQVAVAGFAPFFQSQKHRKKKNKIIKGWVAL
jgi:hypothetical protein